MKVIKTMFCIFVLVFLMMFSNSFACYECGKHKSFSVEARESSISFQGLDKWDIGYIEETIECKEGDLLDISGYAQRTPAKSGIWLEIDGLNVASDGRYWYKDGHHYSLRAHKFYTVLKGTKSVNIRLAFTHDGSGFKDFEGCSLEIVHYKVH